MADPVVTSHHAIAPAPGGEVNFTLDGREVSATVGEFLIAAAERHGVFIPRFCYHPRLQPVGMCRMCLVEVAGPRGATLQPACYVAVSDQMVVETQTDKVRKAQDGVLEFLLANHPLDCPVCDKGGECPLQDQTIAYGPGESRFVEEKRHFAKPIPLSPLVLLDRERCIQCGRCTRFAAEIAGEAQIDFFGRGEQTEVAVSGEHVFSSVFSGNTVQICPVGALTATPYRFTARPWDLDQVESTCTTCAFGCRVAVQSSANRVTRLLGLDVDAVNQSWLCDKGRYGYEAVNADSRLAAPRLRRGGRSDAPAEATWAEALSEAAARLSQLVASGGAEKVALIGGARLSNEDAYAWSKLAKGVIGTDNVDAQLDDGLDPDVVVGLPRATIDDATSAKAVVLLCGDLRDDLPVLFLRLRAAAERGVPLVDVGPVATALSGHSTATVRHRPGDQAGAVAALAGLAPAPDGTNGVGEARALLEGDGEGVVVVLGRSSLAESAASTSAAAAVARRAWPQARFLPALRRGNVMGALDMGLAPGLLPGRVVLATGAAWFRSRGWSSVPATPGRDAAGILSGLADGEIEALILVGADPVSDFPDRRLARAALKRARFVLAVDTFASPSVELADIVLPAVMHHERSGTTTNIEGRITRVGQKVVAPGQCWPDWMIASELAARMGADLGVTSVGDIWDEIERLAPSHAGITRAVLESPAGQDGVIAPLPKKSVQLRVADRVIDPIATPGIESVERQGAPPRAGVAEPLGFEGGASPEAAADGSRPSAVAWSETTEARTGDGGSAGGLRLVLRRRLYDHGVMAQASPALAELDEGPRLHVNPADLGAGIDGRATVSSVAGTVVLAVVADETVPPGTVLAFANAAAAGEADAIDLVRAGTSPTEVTLAGAP